MENTDNNPPSITHDDLSAIDVIRCVYLARMAEKRGDSQSARRWLARVDNWLERLWPPPDVGGSTTPQPFTGEQETPRAIREVANSLLDADKANR